MEIIQENITFDKKMNKKIYYAILKCQNCKKFFIRLRVENENKILDNKRMLEEHTKTCK